MRTLARTAPLVPLWAAAALFVSAAIALPFVGPSSLSAPALWARSDPDWSILVRLRVPRTLLGLFAGGALGLAGALFQSMLRESLATPYTLGVSTGASLGAVLAIAADWDAVAGVAGIWAGALGGAAAVLLIVMMAARRRGHLSTVGLLLAGIALNSVGAALILLVHGLAGLSQSFAISRWLIGGLDAVDGTTLSVYIVVVSVAAGAVVRHARRWNLLGVGEAWAATRGLSLQRTLTLGYVAGSVLAAVTVALTGPIGFIGLIVPHLLRKPLGGDDRLVMPCAFLAGGVLLACCDALGRVLLAPAEIPAGAITAIVGAPHLLWVIRRGTTS